MKSKKILKKIFIILFFEKKFYKKLFRWKNFLIQKNFIKKFFRPRKKKFIFFSQQTDIDLRFDSDPRSQWYLYTIDVANFAGEDRWRYAETIRYTKVYSKRLFRPLKSFETCLLHTKPVEVLILSKELEHSSVGLCTLAVGRRSRSLPPALIYIALTSNTSFLFVIIILSLIVS